MVDLFYFQIKILPYVAASNQHFTAMPEYTKHTILNTLHVFCIFNKHSLHPFSIFYNISIFSFLSLCVVYFTIYPF